MTTTHTLKDKGAAFTSFGERVSETGTGGIGHALCSCGWLSDELTSGKQRVAAHKLHKTSPETAENTALPTEEAKVGPSTNPVVNEPEIATETPSGHRDFPGNYSIVMIPFTEELAKAYGGIRVEQQTFPGKLVRRAHLYGSNRDVSEFLDVLEEAVDEAFDDLHEWQKKTAAERRDQTDMQRYLANRERLTAYGKKVARQIKKDRSA